MKRRFALFAIALAMATPSIASDSFTVGYVDMQKVLEQSKLGKQAQETLKEKFGPKSEELGKTEQALRQQQQSFERDKPLMSRDQIAKKEGELKAKVEAFQKDAVAAQQEVSKEQKKLGDAIIKPTQEIIDALSKEKKVSVVFERHQSGLLYIDSGLDLTDEVIKRLDAKSK